MNIVFFGSSNFAVPPLKALLSCRGSVSCVVTQPDKQKGRHLHFAGTAVKEAALASGVAIYQPDNVNNKEAAEFLKSLRPELFVVIAYGQILSQEILDIPKTIPINLHASLLPKYRGAAPINWAIIKGEKKTGVTIIKMTSRMDAGPVILQEESEITDEDTAVSLEGRLSDLGARLLRSVISSIEENNYKLKPQDEAGVTFAPKLKKKDGMIDWHKSAMDIRNLIRACERWPGAFTCYKGKLLKIYKAKVIPFSPKALSPVAGMIEDVSRDGMVVCTGGGSLVIEELQIEGKRRMRVEEFTAGHKISVGEVLNKK